MKTKNRKEKPDFDAIDAHILDILQSNCKLPLAKIGEQVGLSAPAVIDRIKKFEESGTIVDYRAILDARKLGKDVTAFIGVVIDHPNAFETFEDQMARFEEVLECHHVTGQHTMLLKVKTQNTAALEEVLRKLRSLGGVMRTDTMVVLSTHTERTQIPLGQHAPPGLRARDGAGFDRREQRNGDRIRHKSQQA